jgi:hypothetical protein
MSLTAIIGDKLTLLSIPSKVFTRLTLNSTRDRIDTRLRREQAGFRSNRSCTDQINTLRIIIEQSNEFVANLYLVFVDFEKAFDSLKRNSLWKTMRTYGLPEKIVSSRKRTTTTRANNIIKTQSNATSQLFPDGIHVKRHVSDIKISIIRSKL